MNALISDVKYGLRQLHKSPGFTVAVILIISLGVGANTAIFNALDQVAMRPLPVEKAEDLVSIQWLWHLDNGESGQDGIYNYPVYEAYRDRSDVFSDLIGFSDAEMHMRLDGKLEMINGLGVTGNYFTVLGVNPVLGRVFDAEQEQDTIAHPVAVISYSFWRRQLESKPDVIGKQLVVNDRSLTIIGITPAGFHGTVTGYDADIYVPTGILVSMWNMDLYKENCSWLYLLGRLKPGIGRERAHASLNVLSKQLSASGQHSHGNVLIEDGSRGWKGWEARDIHRPISLFMIAAAFLLITAAFNIANLQLSRAVTRQKEIAIRQALGAGRWHIIRQLLVESVLLALAGGSCGVVLAVWLDRLMCVLMSRIGSISMIPGLNVRVLLFALGISLLTGLLFGLIPALQMVCRNVLPALKDTTGYVHLILGRWNLHNVLVVLQVAMAMMILICAGLFVHSMIVLNSIDPGYDTQKLLAVSVPHSWILGDRPDLRHVFNELKERVDLWPGIEATCLANIVPLGESGAMRGVSHIDGVEIPEQERESWWYGVVGPEYFKILNMPLLAGRTFTDQDNLLSPRVMVINDIMANKYWPNQNPLGKYVTWRGREDEFNVQIIGVVKASKMRSIIEGQRPIAYWPLTQNNEITPALLIRTKGDPRPIVPMTQKEIAALKPREVCHISTVSDRVADLLFPQHAITIILNAFGLAGLLLCVTGIYGVITFAVNWQTHEIGIRMALGAESRHVVASVLRRGLRLTMVGLGLGIVGSFMAIRILQSQLPGLQDWNKFLLYGVNVWDPVTMVSIIGLLLLIALVASYLPARRAAKTDPMEALRYE